MVSGLSESQLEAQWRLEQHFSSHALPFSLSLSKFSLLLVKTRSVKCQSAWLFLPWWYRVTEFYIADSEK